MSKWLRMTQAQKSPVYIAIKDTMTDRLSVAGYFEKTEVLEATGFATVADSIRWDYLRQMIENEHHTELIPLSAQFFQKTLLIDGKRRHLGGTRRREYELLFPEKFVASGHGKRTAGFAIASQENGHFLVRVLYRKQGQARGMVKSANRTAQIASTVHLDNLSKLELIEPPCSDAEC